jgi:hypothetical protein
MPKAIMSRHVDAADLRHLPALGHRANGLAETRLLQKEEGAARDDDGKGAGDDARLGEGEGPEHEGAREKLHRAQVGGEGELGEVHEGDGDTEGQEQRGKLGRIDHPAHEESLQHQTHHEEKGHGDEE